METEPEPAAEAETEPEQIKDERKEFFVVIAPNQFQSNSEFSIFATSEGYDHQIVLDIGVNGYDSDKVAQYKNNQIVEVEPFTTKKISFQIEDINEELTYEVNTTGVTGVEFCQTEVLKYDNVIQKYAFIQTDKSMYKPGDTVKFRVLFLDTDFKFITFKDEETISISMLDPNDYCLHQWNGVKPVKGVIKNEFILPSDPINGDWTIRVEAAGISKSKQLEVKEYVLPKFEVSMNVPARVSSKEGKIVATITANYTNGKPVKGQASLTIVADYDNTTQKTVQIDGKVVVDLLFDEIKVMGDYCSVVTYTTVLDEMSGELIRSEDIETIVQKNKYSIETDDSLISFVPGFTYETILKITNLDQSPVIDTKTDVNIKWNINKELFEEQKINLDEMGSKKMTIAIPQNAWQVDLEIRYLDETFQRFFFQRPAVSTGDIQLKAFYENGPPSLDEDVVIDLRCTEPLQYFNYLIVANGKILDAQTITLLSKEVKNYKLSIKPTFNMLPFIQIVFYKTVLGGIYLSDNLSLNFPAKFRNICDVKFSNDVVPPNTPVGISIKTKPNSYVGLLGVDKSVQLLSTGNDFDGANIWETARDQINYQRERCYTRYRRHRTPFEVLHLIFFSNSKSAEEIEELGMPKKRVIKKRIMKKCKGCAMDIQSIACVEETDLVVMRKNFPETWIFDDIIDSGDKGEITLNRVVPDTMTSWVLTGFSIDESNGFGMIDSAATLNVFQPFYIAVKLPYSIKNGEELTIPVTLFNYTDNDMLPVDIVLDNPSEEFDFIDGAAKSKSIKSFLKAQSGSSVAFTIRPKVVGYISINVKAISTVSSDGMSSKLLVEPEGVTQFVNKGFSVDLTKTSEWKCELPIEIPFNVVPHSSNIKMSVIGDILGTTLSNIDRLIQLPHGCGEQNMVTLVPNIVALEYLSAAGKSDPETTKRALSYMTQGYQRQMQYKHPDGSYSAFGASSNSPGSVWLTAFVAKTFSQMEKYQSIDKSILDQAFQFLEEAQSENGSFVEKGFVYDKRMQSGSAEGYGLTAYILMAFLESGRNTTVVEKGLNYLVENISVAENDLYSLTLFTYVLFLAKHEKRTSLLKTLKSKMKNYKDNSYLEIVPRVEEVEYENCVNIEMTAYCLLIHLAAGLTTECISIMKWLISQRNAEGGFFSTQDTILGVTALAKIAAIFNSNETDIELKAKFDTNDEISFKVNGNNLTILQIKDVPSRARKVELSSTGKGFCVGQVSFKFNMDTGFLAPKFNLDVKVEDGKNQGVFLQISTSYIINVGTKDLTSNMALMEINLPSGYSFNKRNSKLDVSSIKKIETKDIDTKVVVYFNSLDEIGARFSIAADCIFKVGKIKPAAITIYDYYDNSKRARLYYKLPGNDEK